MRIYKITLAAVLLITAPAFGQILKPVLTPPPCQGHNCPSQRGAVTPNTRKSSAQAAECPPGTVYDGYKGTCHVGPMKQN